MLADPPDLGSLVAEYTHIPSNPMIIRRYRPLNERNLRSFFEKGPYCSNITEFDDNNEGLVERGAENPALRSGAVVIANMKRRRRDHPELDLSPEEFRRRMAEFQKQARRKYFANCWRIGTSELDKVWKVYTGDENMVEGFAFETTVGQFIHALPGIYEVGDESDDESDGEDVSMDDISQTPVDEMYVGHPMSDMRVGAVQYQIRDLPDAVQPIGNEASISFFKGSGFDYETEFRFLFNPFDKARVLKFDMDGCPIQSVPDSTPDGLSFPMDTRELVNRIVLAPNAGDEQRCRIEEILDEIGVSYGSSHDTDLEIVESNSRGPPLHERTAYSAEFDGTDNYEGSPVYLNGIRKEFVDKTDPDHWPIIDLVELIWNNAGTVIEGYKYSREDPDFDMGHFGHDGYQSVVVNRIFADEEPEQYMNEDAEERFGTSGGDEGA